MKIIPSEEFISKNWEKTVSVVKSLSALDTMENSRKDCLLVMLGELCERYSFCPASSRKEYYSAFPGGLCFHNLNVLKWTYKLSNAFGEDFSKNSMATIAIMHEIGKLGTKEDEYYISRDSQWHRDRGMYYEVNPKINYMNIGHRSLHLANVYNINLTEDEHLAILLSDPKSDPENLYAYKKPKLALILEMAEKWARAEEKENNIIWE